MKTKFATFDLCAVLHDLNNLRGMRLSNIYDINSKTYLLKLQKPNEKAFILFESGIRIHITSCEWPKAIIPSAFSMKFRKHIKGKRLTTVSQFIIYNILFYVGIDRIVDLKFGDEDRSFHVIVELYDRGNVVLTDHEYIILNILRPRTDCDTDVRFSVKERYPLEQARQSSQFHPTNENIINFLQSAKTGDLLKKTLVRNVPFGSLLLDHVFIKVGIPSGAQISIHITQNEEGAEKVACILKEAEKVANDIMTKSHGGFIAYEEKENEDGSLIQLFKEFYPYDFIQFRDKTNNNLRIIETKTFSEAIDKYYWAIEARKSQIQESGIEKEANRKLNNIKLDHERRIQSLNEIKEIQRKRGEFIIYNKDLVEQALLIVRTALNNLKKINKSLAANNRGPKLVPKTGIGLWLEELADMGEQPAAKLISKLKLENNRFTIRLSNPYDETDKEINVELDFNLNAEQNARQLFEDKRTAEQKKEKTEAATNKALKSVAKSAKMKTNIKSTQTKVRKTNIIHIRKTYWFEKFLWFTSSDGFLVLAGRDAQQNELLVKRYMRPGDIYVHAEIQGGSSVIIRKRVNNPSNEWTPPPKTLNEAATFAVCFSSAWEANVSVTSWWVRYDQVSRTAPTGEYLVSGSFMIRGKRNFLPSCTLQLGFGLMFKLDDESVEARRIKEDEPSVSENVQKDDAESIIISGDEFSEGNQSETEDDDEFPDVKVNVTTSGKSTQNDKIKEPIYNYENKNEFNEVDKLDNEESFEVSENDLIDSLTGNLLNEDQPLFAIPVCAPYTAMNKFKLKVKITPGSCKRGKAVKMALELFSQDKSLTLVERTLLKAQIGDDRLIQLIPGKVRVSAPSFNAKQFSKLTL
ncbi:NFACT-R_1 domain-containing protein [Meloidogyne graminicola]|uniref:NFACT-R_1 domain-containing protein n=1 Tax=Meloidogyne graminicola TaxID=189291 RepID=A0A8T0A0D4_9BILA|nr:NFACT-R_1 domain-containing protein [Meloidogyne graminicola]